ncbi:MAG: Ca-activated chloride channel [Chthoniobacter sp.]|nr:Ca-activated chloride channel [Chthoniobacter sp.]
MKHTHQLIALLLALAPVGLLQASESEANDKTLSPYFLVKGGENSTDAMPLKSTDVDVKIAGVIADVRVTQVYSNAGGVPLEAIYVFPGSTRAAVYGMEMTIGERVLKAQVQKREDARRTYEQAKSEGRSTSLLEQQRPNVFQMNVAQILPGDTIKVELRYTELLVPTAGEYEFVFPTVVAPRYSNQPEAGAPEADRWVKNPYLTKGVKAPATFQIAVEVIAGMPLQDLHCATHGVKPEFRDASHALVRLDGSDALGNDRDFILKYRLADAKIESGLLLSTGGKENFFLLTVQPPKRVVAAELPAREYIFVIDVSGSMNGFPLTVSKTLIKQLLGTLRPQDSFNILLFSGGSTLLAPQSLPASAENLSRAIQTIEREKGGGGTELLPALQQALELPNQGQAARSIVVITDGFVDVETRAFDLIRGNLNRANVFAFGIGSSVNRFLIEGLARAGQGEPFIVTRPDEADAEARKFREYISAPVLTHIQADFGGFETYDLDPVSIPDVLADRPVVLFGKWKGAATGTITVRGKSGGGEYVQKFPVSAATHVQSTQALGYLWARSRIAMLADYHQLHADDERVREVTSLGLTYNLLTAYTSFVAVDPVVRNAGGNAQLVKQPLPLPQGVENSAVGAPISTTPEPNGWMLCLVLAVILGFYRARRLVCA